MTHWAQTHPRARKAHRCDLCGRTIDPGETYRRGVGLDGTAWTWKDCAHCGVLGLFVWATWCEHDDDGHTADCVWDWEPADLAGWRVKALWKRRWRRRDGSLYPVPVADGGASIRVPYPDEDTRRRRVPRGLVTPPIVV